MPAAAAARCARSCCARLCSNVGLCALVAAYALLGAALFEALEAGFEAQQRGRARAHRRRCLHDLWDVTLRLNVLHRRNWTRVADARLRRFEREVAAAAAEGGAKGGGGAARQWTFSGALLYSVTVITTIGYGNLVPRTPEGKLLTMLYALIGVPLVLLCVSNLGALLAGAFQFAYNQWTRSTSPSALPIPPPPPRSLSPSPVLSTPASFPTPAPSPRPPSPTLPPAAVALLAECAEYNMLHGGEGWGTWGAGDQVKDGAQEEGGNMGKDRGRSFSRDEGRSGMNDGGGEGGRNGEGFEGTKAGKEKRKNEGKGGGEGGAGALEEDLLSVSVHQSHRASIRAPLLPLPRPSPAPTPAARVPAAPVLLVLVAYICAGATVFAAWEEWSFLDGAYFCFITLSTIGFGDLVPGKSFERAGAEGGHLQLVACCAYLLLGLVLIAMAFSLLQEEAVARLRRLGAKLRPPSQR